MTPHWLPGVLFPFWEHLGFPWCGVAHLETVHRALGEWSLLCIPRTLPVSWGLGLAKTININ